MRIIGGSAGSRRIAAPPGAATRPTSDRVRESLFAILPSPAPDAAVLDLFAGAGTLGLEALSRGAATALFIDCASASVRCLRKNLADLDWIERAQIWQTDALRALARLQQAPPGPPFQWIFIDPPYATELAHQTLTHLGGGDLLAPDGTVVVEHDRRKAPDDCYQQLHRTDLRNYGDTALSFYERPSA